MNFEWDEAKSDACFTQRGFDFAYVAHAFLDPNRITQPDTRWEYGEPRFQMLGMIEERVFFVAYALRGVGARSAVRIISARKANLREAKAYENGSFDA